MYFIESLSTLVKAREAMYEEEHDEVSITVKTNPKEVTFGHHVDKSSRGVYYFETNAKPPFLKVDT